LNANDSEFGLIAYVSSADPERATRVARKLAAGRVQINTLSHDPFARFGRFEQSGIGREGGIFGLQEYLETWEGTTPSQLSAALQRSETTQ
jgi:aldehyde dehydrogenase (NAD+)